MIKVARLWAHRIKGVPDGSAEIVVTSGNFHGRTTIVSFSTDEIARTGFDRFTPDFVVVPYGDLDALRDAMTPRTVQGSPRDDVANRPAADHCPLAILTSASTPSSTYSPADRGRRRCRSWLTAGSPGECQDRPRPT